MKLAWLFRFLRCIVMAAGIFFISVVMLALTNVPWNWYGSMAFPGKNAPLPPDYVVMMGGGGIPSESGLMRTWKAAEASRLFTNAMIIIAIPMEDHEVDGGSMKRELVLRGVDPVRILREPEGRNTREQATKVFAMLAAAGHSPSSLKIGLVTSPEHMKRTWLSFKKSGFENVIALPSWPEAIAADLDYDEAELGAPSLGGAIGGNLMIKYKIWDNMGLLMRCTRETLAIFYYRLMGWV
jgi:uncharacterized SAM-binding protein YcdF (DUF218 family)